MPSTGASWRIRRRLLAAPLDKEEPRMPLLLGTLVTKGKNKGGSAQKAPATISTRANILTYANSAHAPKNTKPATHSTNITICTGNSRNHSKASPFPLDTGAAVLGSVLGPVLDFVVGCLVGMPHTSALAELLVRGVRASRQVVSWVAGPGLGGGQVAVSPSYASSTWHVTTVSYYGTKEMYVRYDTKLADERRRIPLPRTRVNKGKKG